ncbi:putative protein-lysine deacylase ABHD14B [Clavelina lepadiformis]|uniref:AB hydrolase-1 domain-containing protein n=1 Tax=Clavelina lepadiformis TaxID=159417 RepID=A0ABP0GM68_CLALP
MKDKRVVIIFGIIFFASVCLLFSFYPDFTAESERSAFPGDVIIAARLQGHYLVDEFEKKETADKGPINQRFADIGDGVQVYMRSAGAQYPRKVLLLHGQAYTSETWEQIKTLEVLSGAHYHAIAVDLPGYGNSRKTDQYPHTIYLEKLIDGLNLNMPVVISPSMSGIFSVPYVLSHCDKVTGYVPVSPVINQKYGLSDFRNCSAPTLSVYGENDGSAAHRNQLLRSMPKCQLKMIPNGEHPCYLDDPDLFHKYLLDFFSELKWPSQ